MLLSPHHWPLPSSYHINMNIIFCPFLLDWFTWVYCHVRQMGDKNGRFGRSPAQGGCCLKRQGYGGSGIWDWQYSLFIMRKHGTEISIPASTSYSFFIVLPSAVSSSTSQWRHPSQHCIHAVPTSENFWVVSMEAPGVARQENKMEKTLLLPGEHLLLEFLETLCHYSHSRLCSSSC